MARAFPLLLGSLLITLALAGCVGNEDTPDQVKQDTGPECVADGVCGAKAILDGTGRDLRTGLVANDTLAAPEWEVGDVFEQHLFYGSRDTQGEHIVTMVVDNTGNCNMLATNSKPAASAEVTYDLPILGCIDKATLTTSAFDTAWDWMYSFPLEDGKSWSGRVDDIFNWNQNSFHDYEFTLTAKYEAKIDTPRGNFPGFIITGATPEGEEFLRYNYVPAVGWFSHFWMFDLSTPDPEDIMFHAMSMGTSKGYSGVYYLNTAETAIEDFFLMPPIDWTDGGPRVPPTGFTIPEGATYMKGVFVPLACPGYSRLHVVSPSNQAEFFEHTYEGDPTACLGGDGNPSSGSYTVGWVDRPAQPGDWKIAAAGAGVYGFFVWIVAVTEVEYTLEAPVPTVDDATAPAS